MNNLNIVANLDNNTIIQTVFKIYHITTGYILFPFRIFAILSLILGTLGGLLVSEGLLDNRNLSEKLVNNLIYSLIWICGLNINIIKNNKYKEFVKNNEYPDKKYLMVFNHTNIYDSFILYALFDRMLCVVMINYFAEMFPINILFKISNSIKCNRNKREGVVAQIKQKVEEGHKVLIAPDSCQDLRERELIAPFKTGAFAVQETILPLVIRFVTSSTNNYVWGRVSDAKHIISMLIDGHIEGYIQVLDFEDYNKEKGIEDFRDRVKDKMLVELEALPIPTPPRIEHFNGVFKSDFILTSSLSNIMSAFCSISYLLGNVELCILTMLMGITGTINNNYPTNNVLLMDKLVVGYTGYKYITMPTLHPLELYLIKMPLFFKIVYNYYNLKVKDNVYGYDYYNEVYKYCVGGLFYMMLNSVIF